MEIFKLAKDVECYYEIGEILGDIDRGGQGNTASRSIHFFQGNPADPRSSMSIHVGYVENKIEHGMEESYVEEVFQLDPGFPVRVRSEESSASDLAAGKGFQYGKGKLKFYGEFGNFRDAEFAVHGGRISSLGGMPIELALRKIRKEVDEKAQSRREEAHAE